MADVIKTKISKGFQTVLPSEVRNKLGGEPGDEILWSIVGDEVFIHVKRRNKADPLKGLIGAFSTESEDDATKNIDNLVND
jgi:AbrB family looped-hinge helix DNA binding protein